MDTPLAQGERAAAAAWALLGGTQQTADDAISALESIVQTGGFDDDALRHAGLSVAPPEGEGAAALRSVGYALVYPLERAQLRRGAYRCAALGDIDEAAVLTAVAATVIASDLLRGFDIDEALTRCHQTLLEEAPLGLLERLRLLPADAQLAADSADAPAFLQSAVSAASRVSGVDACRAQFDDASCALATLSALFVALRDGFAGFDIARFNDHPLRQRTEELARQLSAAAEPATADA